ncbi:MAG: hypothetical protein DMD71_03120, partial [Gemmatimonadetes bacterium]
MAVASGNFRAVERSYFDLRWHLDPVAASQAGVFAHDQRYGRYSPDALRPHLVALKALGNALEEAGADALQDEIDRTALLNEVRMSLHRFEKERPQAKNPEFWISHLLGGLHHLLLRRDRTPEARAAALCGRLEDVAGLLTDARATLSEPVRLHAETALRMAEAGLVLIREIPAAVGAEVPALAERIVAAADAAAAALTDFTHNLERWSETGSDLFAVGEDAFNFRLHYDHALRD